RRRHPRLAGAPAGPWRAADRRDAATGGPRLTRGVRASLERARRADRTEGVEGAEGAMSAPSSLRPLRILPDFELTPLLDGYFRLDGGAMFGVVPKTLWEKRAPADERNRIRMAMRPLLVRSAGGPLMIIDAGAGDKMDEESAAIYALDRAENLDVTMATAGVGAEDVGLVLASHLHFDHAGGFTARTGSGGLLPRFPNAR